MKFSFASAGEIKFGNGISRSIGTLLPASFKRIFVVTGSSPNRHQELIDAVSENGRTIEVYPISFEPTIATIDRATQAARAFASDAVIGVGGGSVIDAAKAIAALLSNPGELSKYLETVGKGASIATPSVPFAAIPTTAGTGSEVTRNSVIGVPDRGIKVSMRSPHMLPRWAIIDPELTYGLPPSIAAYTGMDAFVQCIEAFVSCQANPITDGVAAQGIELAAKSIQSACGEALDKQAKENMCAASVCSGLALANAKLGAVHGFAGPLGGMIDAPHGAICASLMIPVWKANYAALSKRDPDSQHLKKMDAVARILTQNPEAKGNYASAWLEKLVSNLPIQRLGQLGFKPKQIDEAVQKSSGSSSMKGNPIKLTEHELKDILDAAL